MIRICQRSLNKSPTSLLFTASLAEDGADDGDIYRAPGSNHSISYPDTARRVQVGYRDVTVLILILSLFLIIDTIGIIPADMYTAFNSDRANLNQFKVQDPP